MPTDHESRYTLTELADLAIVTPRTIRYYIAQGLLSGPASSGPGAKYGDDDLARLRLIKRLQAEHLPLAEIRQRLAGVSDEALDAFFRTPPPAPQDSALEYIRRITSQPRAAEAPALYRMAALTDAPTDPAAPEPLPAMAPPAPVPDVRLERSQWERIDLAPDVELHIRRPLARATAKRVDRLISIARDLLEEDPS
jgi:DNA-binding transcriptional MerR regulator